MKRYVIGFVPLVLLSAIAVYCKGNNPHEFKDSDCVLCHQVDSSGRVNPNGEVTLACEKCHSDLFAEGYMHPVDIRPEQVKVPGDLPLSATGLITCNTCHDVHSSYLTPLGDKSHYLRRYASGKAFCDVCHENALSAPPSGHEAVLGEAHFQARYVVTDPFQKIDPMSRSCISCHDGAFASAVTINAGVWRHQSSTLSSNDMKSHPIGVNYEAARTRHGRKTDLRPQALVDKRIMFFDGKIGCGSCHNPYSRLPKNLVMTNQRSRLCLACHMVDR